MKNHTNPDREQIENENSFLKMKLALERGAHFEVSEELSRLLTPEMENQFLKSIIAFQEQQQTSKKIPIYNKIGKPTKFLPIQEIPEEEIENQYAALLDYLLQHDIEFNVCSPNIVARELYRFITEELFWEEVDDITIPGMGYGFIYDEFYPDPVYDNSRLVKNDLLPDIFRKKELFFHSLYGPSFTFNGEALSAEVFKARIQRFKELCTQLKLQECEINECVVEGTFCTISGFYHAHAKVPPETFNYKGLFEAGLKKNDDGCWNVVSLSLENFNP